MPNPFISSPLLGILVTLGNLTIWLGLLCAVTCVALYWTTMLRTMRRANVDAAQPAEASGGKKKSARQSAQASPADLKTERAGTWARRFFYITSGCMVVGAICLWALIFTQQYSVAYIHKNTNAALPFGFRFAALWSDQEGTFFLWGLYNTLLGSLFLWKARADERWVMPFFTLINVSLFTLLLFMNPFWMHSAQEIRTGLQTAGMQQGASEAKVNEVLSFLPTTTWQHVVYYLGWGKYWAMADGKGLNEQLQNFWMVIHPPTLFLGYSSIMIPACFALGALMRRDYDSWATRAMPWLLFGWGVLGTGIFLGAYWAYETLGWGGYWSWDPVENSSLLPWLGGTALIHGLLAQRARGNFKQANLFIGLMVGALVLLGSFLVRSGVLGETSVHSFAAPQKSVFITLLAVLGIWFVMSVGIWLWRFKDIQAETAYENVWERHFGFFLGLIVLSAITVVVTFGVTFPIWKPWLPIMGGKENVDFTFYNKALLPVTFVLVLLMALTPLMPWRQVRDESRPTKPFSLAALVLSAVFTLYFLCAAVYAWTGGFAQSHNDPAYVGFGLILALALVTNGVCLARARRGGFTNIGPWLAHIGFIVMLAGVVITSRFNTTRSFQKVEVGQAVTALGRQFIYRGQRPAAGPADRDRLLIDMVVNGKTTHLDPKLFVSKISEQTMAWPQIMHEWIGGAWGDVYVEPSGVDNTNVIKIEGVKKNDEKATGTHVQHRSSDPEDELAIRFLGLDTSEMQKQMQQKGGEPKPFTVYANALLYINGTEREIRPALRIVPTTQGIRTDPIPMRVEGLRQGTGYSLLFKDTNMEPGNLDASFELVPDEAVPQGYFQVLHVPGIQVLWWGCYLMIAGAFVSWLRRRNLAGRTPPSIPSSRKGAPAVEQGTPTEPAAERKPELAGARAQATTPRRKATQGEA